MSRLGTGGFMHHVIDIRVAPKKSVYAFFFFDDARPEQQQTSSRRASEDDEEEEEEEDEKSGREDTTGRGDQAVHSHAVRREQAITPALLCSIDGRLLL